MLLYTLIASILWPFSMSICTCSIVPCCPCPGIRPLFLKCSSSFLVLYDSRNKNRKIPPMIYKVFILYSFLIKEVYLCFSRQAQNVFNFIPKGFDFSVTQRARDVFKNTALHFALVIMRALRTKAVLLYQVGVVVFDQ